MKSLILSFKSRNDVFEYTKFLKSNNIPVKVINTPSSIYSSCTLSIKTDFNYYYLVSKLLSAYKPSSFIGLFCEQFNGHLNQTHRLM